MGQVITTPCPTCRGEGRITIEKTTRSTCPPASTAARPCASPAAARPGRAAGKPATCTCTCGWRRTSAIVRDEHDLVTDVPISIAQAALGTTLELETLDGDEELVVAAGTQPGREFVLRRRGVPHVARARAGRPAGDRAGRRADASCRAPRTELLRQFAEVRGEAVGPPSQAVCLPRSSRRSRDRPSARARTRRAPAPPPTSSSTTSIDAVLDDDDRHHLVRVLRVRDGDAVTVTDGRGRWRLCVPLAATCCRPRTRLRSRIVQAGRAPWHSRSRRAIGRNGSCRSSPSSASTRIVLLHAERSVVRWERRSLRTPRSPAAPRGRSRRSQQSRRMLAARASTVPLPAADGAARACSPPSPAGVGRRGRDECSSPSARRAAGRDGRARLAARPRRRSAARCCGSKTAAVVAGDASADAPRSNTRRVSTSVISHARVGYSVTDHALAGASGRKLVT